MSCFTPRIVDDGIILAIFLESNVFFLVVVGVSVELPGTIKAIHVAVKAYRRLSRADIFIAAAARHVFLCQAIRTDGKENIRVIDENES
jgi:hypothetical protein